MNMAGYLAVARVLKVHHKSGTADVIKVNSKDTITSNAENEGRFAARILTQSANFDRKRNKSWGSFDPIAEGSLVLIAYLDNMKDRPVILGSFHYSDNIDNVLSQQYPLNEKQAGFHKREALKYLKVFPSMAYFKVDGESNMEFVHASKTFLKFANTSFDSQGYVDDKHNGFDHRDLTETDPRTGRAIESDWEEAKAPTKMLFVHRSSFTDSATTWTKFFVNEKGMARWTRDNNDGKLTYLELSETGAVKVRRQLDDPDHGEGTKISEVAISEDGTVTLKRVTTSGEVSITLTEDGKIVFQTPTDVDINSKGKIKLYATTESNNASLTVNGNGAVVAQKTVNGISTSSSLV